MYIGGLALFLLFVFAITLYVKIKKIEDKVDGLSNNISRLFSDSQALEEPDEDLLIKRETQNWIQLRKHLDNIVKKGKLTQKKEDEAWSNAINSPEKTISLSRWVKKEEINLPAKDRFSGLLFENLVYDDYIFTKVIKNLPKDLQT